MRLRDVADYLKLRRLTENPWEVLRFRTTQKPETQLVVRLPSGGPPFFIRGGLREYHLFYQVFVKDEYRLNDFRPGCWECVVDLGANVGFFAVRAARLARRVIAYEPFPSHFEQLRRNVADLEVEAVQAAIAAENGVQRLYRPELIRLTGSHSLLGERDVPMSEEFDEVQAATLAIVFARHGIETCDLLKIDIEGLEYDVLCGADEAVLSRIRRIHCEYHGVPSNVRARVELLEPHLRAHGFEVEIEPHKRKPGRGLLFAVRQAK
jgi:FkbM family methyltransferase